NLLFEPWEVRTLAGEPFKVFTAFWRACRSLPSPDQPLPAPRRLPAPDEW
ncbi:deoxyribodipyrimidine photo-lyase, partial [Vibrio parahaemolyticus]